MLGFCVGAAPQKALMLQESSTGDAGVWMRMFSLMNREKALVVAAALVIVCVAARGGAVQAKEKPSPAPPKVAAREVATHHTVTLAGRSLAYTATAGTIVLHDAKDEPTAKMFYIAFTLDNAGPAADRPVTFSYNGGPGAASALVDFGGFGPRKIVWPQPGQPLTVRPPYQVVANEDTVLSSTDLVFVDAVGTGYSRLIHPKGTPKMFYGVNEDAAEFTQFIEQYITKFGRWASPKFLLGESYGTTRSAVLANELIHHGIYLNGVILCSTVLNFPTIALAPGNDLPYILYLPSYAAVARYHHQLHPEPASLSGLVQKAEAFAAGPYATALFQGSNLKPSDLQSLASQLASFTGLPASLWVRMHLRIPLPVFQRRLLGQQDQSAGRYDGRYTLNELEPILPMPGRGDIGATSSAIMGALTASFNDYVERKLNYHTHEHYRQLNFAVNRAWDWKFAPPVSTLLGWRTFTINVAPALAQAMNNDPGLELMVNNGYYDMATPFFATEYTLRHMALSPAAWKRITMDYYRCGHMLYLNPNAAPVLNHNINEFIDHASGGR
jgi:carboxypeptidase C (cathepsin A)